MKKKGGIFVGMIMMFVIYLFAIGIVVVFFYFFKFHITITILDEYRWNKIQEVPLDLLSMSLDEELFVSRMNKVYYLGSDEERDQLRDMVDGNISKQLFYFFEGTQYPIEILINVAGIEITKVIEGCGCTDSDDALFETYTCNSDCAGRAGEECYKETMYDSGGPYKSDHDWCMEIELRTKRYFSAKFPFPLTFNGTDKFVDELSYEVVEEK